MTKSTPLLPIVRKYFEHDPVQAAHSIEVMEVEDALQVLKALPPVLTARAFPYLQMDHAASLLREIDSKLFADIVEHLDPQQGATLLLHLPVEDRRSFLDALSQGKRRQIQELLSYPEDSAGRIMTPEFLAFHTDLTVKDVIQKIRVLSQKRGAPSSYAYVIDNNGCLVGVINMRDLMLAKGDEKLETVMRRDVFSVNGFLDREKVAAELTKRKFFVVPVVDHENRLLGIVRAEDLLEDVQEEATEDIQKMFGVSGDERAFSQVGFSLKKRLPWLHVNLATAFLAAFVVSLFEDTIAKITVLAIFMPVVAGQGGNAGAQSLAVVMRGLVMREIPKRRRIEFIFKEAGIGMINGIVIGLVTGTVAWVWQGNPMLGVVVGLAMISNLFIAGLTGAAIPITMKAIGFDPAQCSNIILTTFTDVMGFFSFLGLAVIFQHYLLP